MESENKISQSEAQILDQINSLKNSPEEKEKSKQIKFKPKKILLVISLIFLGLLLLLFIAKIFTHGNKSNNSSKSQAENISPTPAKEIKEADSLNNLTIFKTQKLTGIPLLPYKISYPSSWKREYQFRFNSLSDLKLSKDKYIINISQFTFNSSLCYYSDSSAFPTITDRKKGVPNDFRGKEYAEIPLETSGFLRRSEIKSNDNLDRRFFFCSGETKTHMSSPTKFGTISYEVPEIYDPQIIKEMDSIVKSLEQIK